ncbi:GTP 3',8-cyclase MoaA [Dechloromonas sp.]|uniref:GTP 3',8-cyclase MoaA n=1 Tax=Dechloromonas sp. TaxID=1917218 RepID=UPI00121DB144|nr:GTP 3',8-cyclase MoaA [Dechloromonas sp.]MBU3697098.1 GTP 3',8-cyclase MoaA [Dechloromonas sp.]TEX49094.1 MAG: GTP 3',8-cyclase MoaA [Rhodocyclaceae bacterium]
MQNESLNPESTPAGLTGFAPHVDTAALNHAPGTLVDKYGRHINYVRLSITDRCDFRCTYCMAEEMTFLPRHEVLSLEECLTVASTFVGLGVSKLRITGGEPLVRKNAMWLIERLGALPGLDNLVLTTNGSQLERYAGALRAAGVRRLNVSLDTLRPDRFKAITRIGELDKVLHGVAAAQAAGFTRTKLNTVMMRGINDDEFVDLVRYVLDHGLDLSFIEEMPLGEIHGRSNTYISSEEVRERLTEHFELLPSTENSGGPARYWRIPGSESRIGFISPHSHNFCDSCNRVRITAKGELYPCLGQNDAMYLLPILRQYPGDSDRLRQAIIDSMGIKPFGHDFTQQMDAPQVVRFMSMTGG